MTISDRSLSRLHELGWSCGDAGFAHENGAAEWLVCAHKGEQQIVVRAPTKDAAWAEAVKQAEQLTMPDTGAN